jgi:hypothetical protein
MPGLSEIAAATENSASGEETAPQDRPILQEPQSWLLIFEAVATLALGAVFLVGVILEKNPLNGFPHLTGWEWPWRSDEDIIRLAVFLLGPFALINFVLRKVEGKSSPRVSIYLGFLALGNFLMQIMAMLADARGTELLRDIVASPSATSYYLDASRIDHLAVWLRHFDQASLGFHSSTHPPGPILFYYAFFKGFGFPEGALIGGFAVGFVGSLGILVTYAFAGLWTGDRRTRVIASAFYALLPALTIFFPEMDQVYPILSMLLILFWCKSLESRREIPWEALCFGAVLFVSVFFAYNLLATGAFLAYYAIYWLWRQRWRRASWLSLLRISAISGAVCAAAFLALWLSTGYNPIASFRHALAYQAIYSAMLRRPYLISTLVDPYDFFLGAGILALPLLLFHLYRMSQEFDPRRKEIALTLIGLATILTIDFTGILRGETSRVWLFLQPLIVVPVAMELSRYRGRWRLALFSMQWLIVACLKAKMIFIRP